VRSTASPVRDDRARWFGRHLAPWLELGALNRPRVRALLLGVAVLGFAGGIVLALRARPATLENLDWRPLLALVSLALPAAVLGNAYEFSLSARLIGRRVSFRTALETTILGNAASLLPLPGGTVVRVVALRAAGGSLQRGTYATVFVLLVWVGTAFAYAGAWLLVLGKPLGMVFGLVGLVALAACLASAVRWIGAWRTPLQLLATKVVLVVLDAIRLYLCLLALSAPASFAQASALTVSGVVGSAVTIVPAGLGVREAVAAALGSVVALAPAACFLAASLNRLLGLAAALPTALVLAWRRRG